MKLCWNGWPAGWVVAEAAWSLSGVIPRAIKWSNFTGLGWKRPSGSCRDKSALTSGRLRGPQSRPFVGRGETNRTSGCASRSRTFSRPTFVQVFGAYRLVGDCINCGHIDPAILNSFIGWMKVKRPVTGHMPVTLESCTVLALTLPCFESKRRRKAPDNNQTNDPR